MAKYRVYASSVTSCYLDVEAPSASDAEDIAENTDGGDFEIDNAGGYWEITRSELITDNASIVVTDIEWDLDDEELESEDAADLPNTITIENPTAEMLEELQEEGLSGSLDAISDHITALYDFCHKGFCVDLIYHDKES